ncbi:hypothetical protein [Neptuniibacter sp.]|uniref:hypothetical protein n=1 Tax=Neptuniibacter sp. TaxID=1962643 RepID=UPI00261915F8|nr:hypothetical protein [Neptuniibacter sp.]MCP4597196.1 hypothetical protein [Neptuniibacter sp.]
MAKRKHHKNKTALLIVGEGPIDKAFLQHIHNTVNSRTGNKVKVAAADGGSPKDVIITAAKYQHASYDKKFVLIDEDIPISQEELDLAEELGVTIFISSPVCLEGMLLEVLGQKAPSTNKECKSKLHPQLNGQPTCRESYQQLFGKEVLTDSQHATIQSLLQVFS